MSFPRIIGFGATLVYSYGVINEWKKLDPNLFESGVTYALITLIILGIPVGCVMWIRTRNADQFMNLFSHLLFFLFCLLIIDYTIMIIFSHEHTESLAFSMSSLPLLLVGIAHENHNHNMLQYCPAIMDIYDGIEMLTSRSNQTSPVWVRITSCLAVITFCIPAFLEIHYLKHPRERVLSEQSVRLAYIICSSMFLAFRAAMFAYKPLEMFFIIKSVVRVYYHDETFANLRRG